MTSYLVDFICLIHNASAVWRGVVVERRCRRTCGGLLNYGPGCQVQAGDTDSDRRPRSLTSDHDDLVDFSPVITEERGGRVWTILSSVENGRDLPFSIFS